MALLVGAVVPAFGADARVPWLWDGAEAPAWSTGEVAILKAHYLLQGRELLFRPRTTRPRLATGTRVTPVVHVEVSTVQPPIDIERHLDALHDGVLLAARSSTSGWVQLDMEARPSQRTSYLALVRRIRQSLPADIRLSVTALAWWCRSPSWLDDIAADEVVPMFFRMGRDGATMRGFVMTAPDRLHGRCSKDAAGFSVQEAFEPSVAARYRRTYWFDNSHWRASALPARMETRP